MQITRTSLLTGIARTLDINVTQEELDAWKSGKLIQQAMPQLSDDDREFILTGITKEEWDAEFQQDGDN